MAMNWAEPARWTLTALFLGHVVGCEATPVSARAVWLDVVRRDGQPRTIHVYDRGAASSIEVSGIDDDRPYVPVLLDPTGRRVAVRGPGEETKIVDLIDGRTLTVRTSEGGAVDPRPFVFTHRGDALIWSDYETLHLVPLSHEVAAPRDRFGRTVAFDAPGYAHWIDSALTAAVVWTYEGPDASAPADLVARRYPVDADDDLAFVEIGRYAFALDGHVPTPSRRMARATCLGSDCPGDYALAAAGDELVYRASEPQPCGIWWRLRSGGEPECLALPAELGDANILGIVGRERYVFGTHDAVYLWHRGRLSTYLVAATVDYTLHRVDAGRKLVLASTNGPTIRVDRNGIRPLTIAQAHCDPMQLPVVSPSGRWLAWTCGPREELENFTRGAVVRVSAAGIDRFEGIWMNVLAVDDGGSVLMNSFAETYDGYVPGESEVARREPKTLYGLHADDVLDRLDDLEPTPDEVLRPDTLEPVFIQAVAVP